MQAPARSLSVIAMLMLLSSTAHAAKPPPSPPSFAADAPWRLKLPETTTVVFHGLVSYDGAGSQQGAMLYPAIDPLTFLVGLATHGVINESVKHHQKSKLQEEADKVLQPYQTILEHFTHRELMQRGLALSHEGQRAQLTEADDVSHEQWTLVSSPAYSLTQDQRAIVLDNTVVLYAAGSTKPTYANSVRVVSDPRDATDPQAQWQANDGQRLKDESAFLFANSIDVFLHELDAGASTAAPQQRTVRYARGGSEAVERAFVLGESCTRLTLKTLRGWLMSVPVAVDGGCPSTPESAEAAQSPPPAATTNAAISPN
jgi:hypothetical protein